MKNPRTCPLTGKSLDGFHGNRKVHPEAEKLRKDTSNKKRHEKVKEMNKQALKMNKILEHYYQYSKGETEIPRNMLIGFSWNFITSISNSKPPIFWILDFGYSFNTNKEKIIIYHKPNRI